MIDQRAMIGDDIREIYAKAARERQKTSTGGKNPQLVSKSTQAEKNTVKGKSRDLIGHMMGVSGQSIDRARTVKQKGTPELVEAVRTSNLKISTAALRFEQVTIPFGEPHTRARGERTGGNALLCRVLMAVAT